jgi:hypothetical protein
MWKRNQNARSLIKTVPTQKEVKNLKQKFAIASSIK